MIFTGWYRSIGTQNSGRAYNSGLQSVNGFSNEDSQVLLKMTQVSESLKKEQLRWRQLSGEPTLATHRGLNRTNG